MDSARLTHSREDLIARLRDVAASVDAKSVSRTTWLRETGINEHHILKEFDSWNAFVRAAGLVPDDRTRLEDSELFLAMRDALVAAEGVPTRAKFRKVCRYSDDVYAKRWGRWQNVLAQFREWAEVNEPDFPYLAQLPGKPVPLQDDSGTSGRPGAPHSLPAWESNQRAQYGPFINFRGLQHAPINEQGVVFLFGIVAFDLGYVVEGVGTGFPDCEAKRSVSSAGDAWERVRIEFEYRSRTFRDHGHDPASCDLIVCWEHNWPQCPLEVLELRSAIGTLGE